MKDSSEDFNFIQTNIFEGCGFEIKNLQKSPESEEYFAHSFLLQGQRTQYRQAKITPTKAGQFVTLWKRNRPGAAIQPYDGADDIDLIIITVRFKSRLGQFVFPKEALLKHGVFSIKGQGGKRALRVYPPWDKTKSTQARKTQEWQLDYFVEITENKALDRKTIRALYLA
ncbi:MAG: MepB family protein [Bdellovibrio sp.]